MIDPVFVITASALVGLCIVAFALLRGWQGWLELKKSELERSANGAEKGQNGSQIGAARIELADLKERIRKLEAIASGVDL